MENSYEILKLRRQELCELAHKQLKLSSVIDGNMPEGTLTGEKKVSGIIERLKNDKFRVLVMGCFSSGKSTFLNALLGERILPSCHEPCTGVLTTINYADSANKKLVLYPKHGTAKDGEEAPVEISGADLKEALKRHVQLPSGCDQEDAAKESRYEKVELFYPLNLCRNGVEIIDSVGLNDPVARDVVTYDYAEKIDAVIYCMISLAAKNKVDKDTFERLEAVGTGKSIFFILTYFDAFRKGVEDDGEDLCEKMKQMSKSLIPKTGLGEKGIKFVDSRGALKGDSDARKRMDDVAKSLEEFLVSQKGNSRLSSAFYVLRSVNEDALRRIPEKIGMLRSNVKSLEDKMKKAEVQLKNREKQLEGILEDISCDGDEIVEKVCSLMGDTMDKLKEKLPVFIDDYEFKNSELEKRGKELSEAVRGIFEKTMLESQERIKTGITPNMERMMNRLTTHIADFSRKISDLKNDVGFSVASSVGSANIGKADVGILETIGISSGVGIAGGLLGVGLFPIIPVAAAGYFVWKWLKKEIETEKLRDSMKNECEAKIFAQKDEFVSKIAGGYKDKIREIREKVGQELQSQIDAFRANGASALAGHKRDQASLDAEIRSLEQLKSEAENIRSALSAFAGKMGFEKK